MDYMTLKEAAEKWGVTPRRVNYYCAGGRIPGAVKMAGIWLIPKDAEKPIDMGECSGDSHRRADGAGGGGAGPAGGRDEGKGIAAACVDARAAAVCS